jgi:Zn-dependent protease
MASWALTVAKWRGVPIKVHAALPLGLFAFSGFRFDPVGWACMLGIVLLHELGHAWVVRLVGGRATEVMLHGFGGWCAWRGDVTKLGRAAIACGGIAAQLVLMLIVLGVDAAGFWPQDDVSFRIFWSATYSNAYLVAFNLLPIAPLDGAEAWAFPALLGRRARLRLTTHQNVEAHVAPDDEPETSAQARDLAAQLLADARKDEGDE